jgi:hypothetical protein
MRLLHLDLQGNRLTSVGCGLIAEGLRRNKYLLFIGLQWNLIDDAGAEAVGRCVTRNTALKAIFLMGNKISPTGARCILEGSLTFDDTPVCIDIESLPPRPPGKRVEAEAELEKTHFEDDELEEAFAHEAQAFRVDIVRNELGEEVDVIKYVKDDDEEVVLPDEIEQTAAVSTEPITTEVVDSNNTEML